MNIENDQVLTKWPCNKVDEIINNSVNKAQYNMPRKIHSIQKILIKKILISLLVLIFGTIS